MYIVLGSYTGESNVHKNVLKLIKLIKLKKKKHLQGFTLLDPICILEFDSVLDAVVAIGVHEFNETFENS